MKKLIFLLIAVSMICFTAVMAAAHPPDGNAIEAALSEFGAEGRAVTPDTVQVTARFHDEPCRAPAAFAATEAMTDWYSTAANKPVAANKPG